MDLSARRRDPIGPGDRQQPTPAELQLAGEIALLLEGGSNPDGLDAALLHLRDAVSADVCELFIVGPRADEMVLVSHHGPDVEAFTQLDRFDVGEGFPGIVLDTGEALATRSLASDDDFLRFRVKAMGYTGAVCLPLRAGQELRGCLLLAWKEPPPEWGSHLRAAWWVGVLVGAAVDAACVRARLAGLRTSAAERGALEESLRALAAADEARLALVGHSSGDDAAEEVSPCVSTDTCRACLTGEVQVLGGRKGWPEGCIASRCVTRARYCVPLTEGADVVGLATVAWHRHAPAPVTRRLPAILWFLEGYSSINAERTHPADSGRRVPRSEFGKGARLQVRCLGGFEVRLEGRVLRAADFGRSKAYELLACLAAANGLPLPSEALARVLWPRIPLASILNRLHVTLSALRRVVEPPGSRRPEWLHVRTNGNRYFLDQGSSVWVDLAEFDRLARLAERQRVHDREGVVPAPVMGELAELYRGDAFHGAFDADWAMATALLWRERWARLQATAGTGRPSVPRG